MKRLLILFLITIIASFTACSDIDYDTPNDKIIPHSYSILEEPEIDFGKEDEIAESELIPELDEADEPLTKGKQWNL